MAALSPKAYLRAMVNTARTVTRHRELTWAMTRREIVDRYAGQWIGLVWTILHPLLIIAVFIFVFQYVFQQRTGGTVDLPFGFSIFLLSGLIPWLGMQEVLSRSTAAITGNSVLVKQVIFPLEVLPVKLVLSTLLSQGVSFALLIVWAVVSVGYLPWTYLLLPVLMFLQVIFSIGVAYILSSVGVFLRDIKDFIQMICFLGIYILPIIFPPAVLEGNAGLRIFFTCNPLSHMIWCYQDALYFTRFEHPWSWLVFVLLTAGVFAFGARLFGALKSQFGSHL